MTFKVLTLKEFAEFEKDVITLIRMNFRTRSCFTSAELNPVRQQLAQMRYKVDKVFLKGHEPKETPIAEATVAPIEPVISIEPEVPVTEEKPMPKKRGRKVKVNEKDSI